MNLLVLGPGTLKDLISQLIETTRVHFKERVPSLSLRLVDAEADADVIVEALTEADEPTGKEVRLRLLERADRTAPVAETFASASKNDNDETTVVSFERAVWAVYREAQLQSLHRTVAGPLSHDMRGALSVVSLSRQLLEAGGDGKLLGGKLRRVDSKISAALSDLSLRSLCLAGAFPPTGSEESVQFSGFETLPLWFSDAHPDRELNLEATVPAVSATLPSWFSVVLGGALDGVARLTRGAISVSAEAPDGGPTPSVTFRVVGAELELRPEQEAALDDAGRWSFLDSEIIPYRLATLSLVVLSAKGSVTARQEGNTLCLSYCVPLS